MKEGVPGGPGHVCPHLIVQKYLRRRRSRSAGSKMTKYSGSNEWDCSFVFSRLSALVLFSCGRCVVCRGTLDTCRLHR
jgi:hypothetical protein